MLKYYNLVGFATGQLMILCFLCVAVLADGIVNFVELNETLSSLGCFSKREGRYPKPPCPLENITATTNCSTFQPFVIECDASGNVIRLQLSQIANDGGFLSQSISALTALEHLDLGYSNLVSTLPATLFQLTRLTHLSLNDNDWKGSSIPTTISMLTALQSLRIDRATNLVGPIPFVNATKLMNCLLGGWFVAPENVNVCTTAIEMSPNCAMQQQIGGCHCNGCMQIMTLPPVITLMTASSQSSTTKLFTSTKPSTTSSTRRSTSTTTAARSTTTLATTTTNRILLSSSSTTSTNNVTASTRSSTTTTTTTTATVFPAVVTSSTLPSSPASMTNSSGARTHNNASSFSVFTAPVTVASRSTHKDVVASASANDNDNEPLYIGIGIGALCVVVVVVVVVATLAIIRRRRQRDESTAASVAAPTQSSIVISDPVSDRIPTSHSDDSIYTKISTSIAPPVTNNDYMLLKLPGQNNYEFGTMPSMHHQ